MNFGISLERFNPFSEPSAQDLAQNQLKKAELALLEAQSQAEHAHKMVEYYEGVVRRLSQYLQ